LSQCCTPVQTLTTPDCCFEASEALDMRFNYDLPDPGRVRLDCGQILREHIIYDRIVGNNGSQEVNISLIRVDMFTGCIVNLPFPE